ncbi:MAG: molybdate ABC transporter substrate-binding protein [Ornithinimicrobium sp.]
MAPLVAAVALGPAVALGSALLGGCAAPNTVTILAAASLSDVMPELIALGEEDRGTNVRYEVSYAGSSQLVQQLNGGASADVVILAGEGPLSALDPALGFSRPTIIATNSLALVTPPSNPAQIRTLSDLSKSGVKLVVCAPPVPCGSAAAELFDQANLTPQIASYEPDARATLAKVVSGEADAGIVYVTDAADAGLPTTDLPPDIDVINRYPLLHDLDNPRGEKFLNVVQTRAGQQVLDSAGFGIP